MANRIVLISDDSDFFDYMRSKLELRKSDELFMFSFDAVPEKIHLLYTAVLIVNSEGAKEKTLDLLSILKGTPIIVSAYNDDEVYRRKCYRAGMFDFITLLTSDADFRSRMIPALAYATLLNKNKQYRDILVDNDYISKDNEVFINYEYIIDKQLEDVYTGIRRAVFAAISPNDKSMRLLNKNIIEATILNNIRKNDILMNYASSKYFLIMYDTDIESAKKVWTKINSQLPEKIYAGFCSVSNQKRQQLINEVLNKLHAAINADRNVVGTNPNPLQGISFLDESNTPYTNFKMFKQDFVRKIEQVINPVFYQAQQKYSLILPGVNFELGSGDGYGTFYIKGKHDSSCFRITCPGFSKVNIDITYQRNFENVDSKRITIEPEELEQGLLEDLLEQFILEYKRGCKDDS